MESRRILPLQKPDGILQQTSARMWGLGLKKWGWNNLASEEERIAGERGVIKITLGGTQTAWWVQNFGHQIEITRTTIPYHNLCVRRETSISFSQMSSEKWCDLPV